MCAQSAGPFYFQDEKGNRFIFVVKDNMAAATRFEPNRHIDTQLKQISREEYVS